MKIHADRVSDKQQLLHGEEPVESFPVLHQLSPDECRFLGPVAYQISFWKEFDIIRVKGCAAVLVSLFCSRCLAAFDTELHSSFTILYHRSTPGKNMEAEEVELASEDLVSTSFSGEEIDLTFEIGEHVAMEIPLKPLCSEGCCGICPVCGCDRNFSSCNCSEVTCDSRFSALKDFKIMQ